MLASSTLASLMLSPPRCSLVYHEPNVSLSCVACCCCRPSAVGWVGSHLETMASMSVKLRSTEPGLKCGADSFLMTASDCVGDKHSEHTWSSSAEVSFQWHPEAGRATNTQQTWRQEFLGSRSSTVERSSTRTAAARTFLRFFQTIFENTPLWRLKRLVTLSTYRCCINECIYLSYLSIYL